jgi:lipid-binding SYLF domain-containing protein
MHPTPRVKSSTRFLRVFLSVFFAFGTLSFGLNGAAADDLLKAKHLVEKARLTWQSFAADPNMKPLIDLAKKAKGVFIAPQILKGAFIFGASGGSGVLLTREQLDGPWSGPAFYTLGSANFGLQIGGQAAEVALLAMTDRGVTAFLASNFKLGGDVGLALGPVGAGASAATANLSVDILSFSRAKGLYGGISVDGAVIAVRKGYNSAYYGKEVRVTDILVRKTVKNPHSGLLIVSVAQQAGGK